MSEQLDDLLNASMGANDQAAGTIAANQGARNDIVGQMGAIQDPPAPNMATMPAPPQRQAEDPAGVFQNAGVILALMGSALTKAPMTTAFKVGAAAIQGQHAGDMQANQSNQAAWQQNLNAALRQNGQELAKYKAAIEKNKGDMNKLMTELKVIAADNKDAVAMAALRSNSLGNFVKVQNARDAAQRKLETIANRGAGAKAKAANAVADIDEVGAEIDDLISQVKSDPSLVGAKGKGERLAQNVTGQFGTGMYPQATQFKGQLDAVRAKLTGEFLKSRYFTGASEVAIERIVNGTDWLDDPQSVIQNLQTIRSYLIKQREALSQAGPSSSGPSPTGASVTMDGGADAGDSAPVTPPTSEEDEAQVRAWLKEKGMQ